MNTKSGLQSLFASIILIGGGLSVLLTVKVLLATGGESVANQAMNGTLGIVFELGKYTLLAGGLFLISVMGSYFLGTIMLVLAIPLIGISLFATVFQINASLAQTEIEAVQDSGLRDMLETQITALSNSTETKNRLASDAAKDAAQAKSRLAVLEPKLATLTADNQYFDFLRGSCIPKTAPGGGRYKKKSADACSKIAPIYSEVQSLKSQLNAGNFDTSAELTAMSSAVEKLAAIDSGKIAAMSAPNRALEVTAHGWGMDTDRLKTLMSQSFAFMLELLLVVSTFGMVILTGKKSYEDMGRVSARQEKTFGFVPHAQHQATHAEYKGDVPRYAKGGPVPFTGYAYVDGTEDKPEYMFSAPAVANAGGVGAMDELHEELKKGRAKGRAPSGPYDRACKKAALMEAYAKGELRGKDGKFPGRPTIDKWKKVSGFTCETTMLNGLIQEIKQELNS